MSLSLPVEIVDHILELASAIPDTTNTWSLYPRCAVYPDHTLPLSDIKLSTRSLFSLALVCRQWNTICIPKLYKCLAIVDSTNVDALVYALENSQTMPAISGRIAPLGDLTRHLIIALSDYPTHQSDTERLETRVLRRFGNLGRLALSLTRLQILSISIHTQEMWGLPPPYYGKDFAAVVTQNIAPSLRQLHLLLNPFILFSRPELRKFLESAPNLVAITGASVRSNIGCPAALPHLPNLKYLDVNSGVGMCDTDHEDNRTPCLDHVHIRPSRISNHWKHLLSSQGATLTSVSLDLRFESDNFSPCLTMLTEHCPDLSYLEICINTWTSFPQLDGPLPPVEHLGISLQNGNMDAVVICEKLKTIQSPYLKVVHLIDTDTSEWFASPLSNNVESAWSSLVGHSFRIVDCNGRELGPAGRSSQGHKRVDPLPLPATILREL
ncbi:hypothetical protein BC827DRAFT_1265789 [Russula dissimulans]|nr:hypothetical protein BC827DRAFT_1265789 [Russula dissimulans]